MGNNNKKKVWTCSIQTQFSQLCLSHGWLNHWMWAHGYLHCKHPLSDHFSITSTSIWIAEALSQFCIFLVPLYPLTSGGEPYDRGHGAVLACGTWAGAGGRQNKALLRSSAQSGRPVVGMSWLKNAWEQHGGWGGQESHKARS